MDVHRFNFVISIVRRCSIRKKRTPQKKTKKQQQKLNNKKTKTPPPPLKKKKKKKKKKKNNNKETKTPPPPHTHKKKNKKNNNNNNKKKTGYLMGIDALSKKATMLKCYYLTSENRSSKFFPFRLDSFSEDTVFCKAKRKSQKLSSLCKMEILPCVFILCQDLWFSLIHLNVSGDSVSENEGTDQTPTYISVFLL